MRAWKGRRMSASDGKDGNIAAAITVGGTKAKGEGGDVGLPVLRDSRHERAEARRLTLRSQRRYRFVRAWDVSYGRVRDVLVVGNTACFVLGDIESENGSS